MTDIKRPIRLSATMQLYKGSKVTLNKAFDRPFIWLDFENYYGGHALSMFLPDGTDCDVAQKICDLLNQSLTITTQETDECLSPST